MKVSVLLLFTYFISMMHCSDQKTNNEHVFYLHGMIIEIQGVNAVSDQFGEYRYNDIIDSLKSTGAVVHNEVRTTQTDFNDFCRKVSDQINDLVTSGIDPGNITVIGASKGAMMSMNISDMNEHRINYVLLGANSDRLENSYDWTLHGNILGIYEKSDKIAGKNYDHWIEKSKTTANFTQLEINTGLGHGFLFRPIKEWWEPVKKVIYKS